MAPFVARNGPAFEAVAVKENAKKHTFSFLTGGAGAEYYRWRVQVFTLLCSSCWHRNQSHMHVSHKYPNSLVCSIHSPPSMILNRCSVVIVDNSMRVGVLSFGRRGVWQFYSYSLRMNSKEQVAKAELRATAGSVAQRRAPLNADDRGALLGEAALPWAPSAAQPAVSVAPNISAIAGQRLCLPVLPC